MGPSHLGCPVCRRQWRWRWWYAHGAEQPGPRPALDPHGPLAGTPIRPTVPSAGQHGSVRCLSPFVCSGLSLRWSDAARGRSARGFSPGARSAGSSAPWWAPELLLSAEEHSVVDRPRFANWLACRWTFVSTTVFLRTLVWEYVFSFVAGACPGVLDRVLTLWLTVAQPPDGF